MAEMIVNHDEAVAFTTALNERHVRNFVTLALEELLMPFVRPAGTPKAEHLKTVPSSPLDLLFVARALARLASERQEALQKALRGEQIHGEFEWP
jgi:hypothetical protein